MHLGTNTLKNTKELREKREHFFKILAALGDGPLRAFNIAEACDDEPTLAQAEDLLNEAANLGFVAYDEASERWSIVAQRIPFDHQGQAAKRLEVGESTLSRWVQDGLVARPAAVYVAQGGLHTFPVPAPLGQGRLALAEDTAAPSSVPPASAPPAPLHPSRPPAPTPPAAPVAPVVELPLADAARLVLDLGDHPAAGVLARRVIERVARGAA